MSHPSSLLNNETGEIALKALAGPAGFVAASAGFGLLITPDRPISQWFIGLQYSGAFSVRAPGDVDRAKAEAGFKYIVRRDEDVTISATHYPVYDVGLAGPTGPTHHSQEIPVRTGFVNVPTEITPGDSCTLIIEVYVYSGSNDSAHALAECNAVVSSMGYP